METKIEVNTMKNEHVIIAALAIVLAGTGYYAYTEHQQVQDLQAQVDDTNKKLAQSQSENHILRDGLNKMWDSSINSKQDNQEPAVVYVQGDQDNDDNADDILRQMQDDDIRQKASDYLDKMNRKLDDEYWSQDVKMKDFSK